MSADRLQKLLALADPQDQDELTMAHGAMVSTLAAHGAAPSTASVANKNAAREDYEATLARLEAKYCPSEQQDPGGERFPSRKQALNWLNAQGYKVSQGKFYQDCKDGFPVVHRDGTVSRYQVMQYGQQLDISSRSIPQFDQSARREDLEIRKLEADVLAAESKARKEDTRWMLKEDAWSSVAALLSGLQDSLRHHLHEGQGLVVHLAGGKPDREPEVYEAMVDLVGKAFNELAASRIEGLFSESVETQGEDLDE
jgi:hypothetical protein